MPILRLGTRADTRPQLLGRTMRKLSVIVAGATGAVLATASLSFAAAAPSTPAAGAATDSHPTFTWSLPANEQADILQIASSPATTPSGEFYDENVVETGFLGASDQSTWSPSSALFSGAYWWNVRSHDREDFTSFFSTPSPFAVASQVRLRQVRIRRNSYSFIPDDLSISVSWATNVRHVVVQAKLFQGRRQVGRVRDASETLISLDADDAFLTWRRPRRVKTGARLRVVVSVLAGRKVASIQRFVRAP
jgi:hypothetical protein